MHFQEYSLDLEMSLKKFALCFVFSSSKNCQSVCNQSVGKDSDDNDAAITLVENINKRR